MRELKVAGIDEGISVVFDEIEALALRCRFADCRHASEPGCAVQAAVQAGTLTQRRLQNYFKLLRENERHSASLSETRKYGREFARVVKDAVAWKKGLKN